MISVKYYVDYYCINCMWVGKISFDKGILALESRKCPRCECLTARKGLKPFKIPSIERKQYELDHHPHRLQKDIWLGERG